MKGREFLDALRMGGPCALVLLIVLSAPYLLGRAEATVATFSQYDPDWPVDAHTAFSMTTPAGQSYEIHNLEWRGKFYNGEEGFVTRFYFRIYEDSADRPDGLLSERTINSFITTDPGDGTLTYSAAIQPLSLPPSTSFWAEVQAEGPAIPQWGLVTIESLPIGQNRLIRSDALGFPQWGEYTEFEVPFGGGPRMQGPPVQPQFSTDNLREPNLHPNPGRGEQLLAFSLERPARLRGVIYDVGGRSIRTLLDGSYPAGRHIVTWDGRTESGLTCHDGIYFLRLFDSDTVIHRKILVLKEVSR